LMDPGIENDSIDVLPLYVTIFVQFERVVN
jgi:hypothetical protein